MADLNSVGVSELKRVVNEGGDCAGRDPLASDVFAEPVADVESSWSGSAVESAATDGRCEELG